MESKHLRTLYLPLSFPIMRARSLLSSADCNKFGQGMKISKEYEKKGGAYENEPGTDNKPQKGEIVI